MSDKERPNRAVREAEFLDELRDLSIKAAHELLFGLDRLRQLRDTWEWDEDGGGEEARHERERMRSLAYEFARNEIHHAQRLITLSHAQADMLFDHARGIVRRVRRGSSPAPRRVLSLDIDPEKTEEPASARVELPNTTSADGHATLKASKWRNQDGEEREEVPRVSMSAPVVPANSAAFATLSVKPGAYASGVYFADAEIFLLTDVEQCVVRRVLRLYVP